MTLELLAPPPPRQLPAARKAADRAQLRRLPVAEPGAPRRRKAWFTGLSVAALVVAGGATATALITLDPQPATVHDSARCYSEASQDFSGDFPGVAVGLVVDDGTPERTDERARDLCALQWRIGVLPDNPMATPGAARLPVPDLVTCVLPDGQVGVFPGAPPLCDQLGLAPLLEGA